MHMCTHTYTVEYYSVKRKKDILPFATQMDPEGVTVSERSQTGKEKHCVISLIYGIYKRQTQKNKD